MYTRHLLHVSDVRNFLLFARFRCMQFSFFRTCQIYALIVFYCMCQIYALIVYAFSFFFIWHVSYVRIFLFSAVSDVRIFFARFRCLHISISCTCQMYAFLYFSQCWTYAFKKKNCMCLMYIVVRIVYFQMRVSIVIGLLGVLLGW